MHWFSVDWSPILDYLIKSVIVIAAGFVVKFIKDFILPKIKKQYALLAVKFVEQKFGDMENAQKYAKAAQWFSDRLAKIHIKMSVEEVEGYIEYAVHQLKLDMSQITNTKKSPVKVEQDNPEAKPQVEVNNVK